MSAGAALRSTGIRTLGELPRHVCGGPTVVRCRRADGDGRVETREGGVRGALHRTGAAAALGEVVEEHRSGGEGRL